MVDIHALIIDDEEFCVEALKEDINWIQCGISSVHGVFSTRQAKNYLGKHFAHILICDIEMPGENGLELVEWATEWARFNETPVECIMLTCHPEYDFTRKALQLGCLDYLLKPVDAQDMERCLKEAVLRIAKKAAAAKAPSKMTYTREDKDIVNHKIIPYIEEHIGEPLSVAELAEYVSLNAQYMMRLFKRSMKLSVLEYITGRRLELAKDMLLKTDWSLEVITEKIGYYSSGYFIKLFKRAEGITPGEYRRKYL